MPPYEQPREYVNAWLLDGELRVEVDCYSATDDSGEDFDVDRWEAEKFVMTAVPGRDVWRHMYRAARAFMHGYRIDFGDGRPVGLARLRRQLVTAQLLRSNLAQVAP